MRNWTHHYARINGIQMHYVEEGQGPLVLLLHGFPHTWFSWRHQITALAEAGYRVVAPDLRGMGQTEAPEELAAYRADVITADLVGLLDHLGEEQAVVSGIDYGMFAAYDLAAEHPERVRALIGLQYAGLPHYDALPSLTEIERGKEAFNHMAYYHVDPQGARADYDANPREIISKIFHVLSTDGDFGAVYANPPGTAYRQALPQPPALPWSWLDEWELETYVSDFSRSGFGGGINWYRVADLNWEYRNARAAGRTNVPYYFLGSETDLQLAEQYGDGIQAQLDAQHEDVRSMQTVPGGGYLIAMERAAQVTDKFLEFLHDMDRVNA